ncbi:DUF2971 domain-containing protein [Pseudoalteromonas sp. NZS100_1]|uniref:DUF2971 domain-containing protein n=1 Tax=Pseudoalteromonas sp. NZS100_1 TaxID=2792073 RepID=UPI0018CD45BD|nr:DUF2971 domain-containing protein [Pseudoalteromonas sp. NZS100_1]MBH0010641.1 DUF2971 domain-containing protein [Pseudoalteromonas sp. NZS100_1]
MDDKKVIDLIRNGRFSILDFFEEDDVLGKNENYLGYLYFMRDLKSEPTAEILSKICEVEGSIDLAYEYLGQIAKRVFYYGNERYISDSFFKMAISKNDKNANAWWAIFTNTNDENAFLRSIMIDYEQGDFLNLNKRLSEVLIENFDFKKDVWNFLIETLNDERVDKSESVSNILFTAFSKTGRHNEGIYLFDDVSYSKVGVLKSYISSNTLSYESAMSKVIDYDLDEFLDYNFARLFEELIKRKNSGAMFLNKASIIETAFKAELYKEVIKIYNENWDEHIINNSETKCYYLMSQIFLGVHLDQTIYDEVKRSNYDGALKKAVEVKLLFMKLMYKLVKGGDLKFRIAIWSTYQAAEKLLEDPELIDHYLYSDLYHELSAIEKQWNKKFYQDELDMRKQDSSNDISTFDTFVGQCKSYLSNQLFKELIYSIQNYHQTNKPTIVTYNLLGVGFDRMGDHVKACESYLMALQIMEKCKEYDYIVIGNFLSSVSKVSKDLKNETYYYWRRKFNIALVNSFQFNNNLSLKNTSLFKYSPLNLNYLDSLINQYFYLPEKQQLNDPIEMPSISDIGEEHFIDKDYRICSFSKNDKSMLMWSHYTGDHQGIMVEYEFGYGLPTGFGISEVKYTYGQKRQVEKDKFIFDQYLLTKNKEWEYEEEVRLISYQASKVYYERYSFPNPDRSKINARVLGITLGCNFPLSKLDFIKKIIIDLNKNRNQAEPKIYLRKATISEEKLFTLEYDYLEI